MKKLITLVILVISVSGFAQKEKQDFINKHAKAFTDVLYEKYPGKFAEEDREYIMEKSVFQVKQLMVIPKKGIEIGSQEYYNVVNGENGPYLDDIFKLVQENLDGDKSMTLHTKYFLGVTEKLVKELYQKPHLYQKKKKK